MKTYAIGDIHGEREMLLRMLAWIDLDAKDDEAQIVFLGDFIDRGPDSRGVLEILMAGPSNPKHTWTCLAGNHDLMMVMTYRGDRDHADMWAHNGGCETLESYGAYVTPYDLDDVIDAARKYIPKKHIEWMEQLGTSADDGERFYCHAGAVPHILLEEQSMDMLLWYRHPKTEPDFDFGKVVVHGHTPNFRGPYIGRHRINLDTGACFGGKLTCAMWENGSGKPPRIYQVSPNGRDGMFGNRR